MILMPFLFMELSWATESAPVALSPSSEDYDLYDRIVEDKFLTSQVQLVLLERMTVSRLVPNQDTSMTLTFFQEQDYFEGKLPPDLVRDFVGANHVRGRLEGRFHFGVRYRFVSDGARDETEVSAAMFARNDDHLSIQVPAVLERLAFSRVGRTLKNDQALVYVEQMRRDGTGAGFLVWFHRQEQQWAIFDTEVVWTIGNRTDE